MMFKWIQRKLIYVAQTVMSMSLISCVLFYAIAHNFVWKLLHLFNDKKAANETSLLHKAKKYVNVYEVAAQQGYELIDHSVQTEDGFLLTVHELSNKRNVQTNPLGAVILQHGLFQSSMLFLMNTNEDGLAYILADMGYTVWITNSRGNIHSRKHLHYTTTDPEFWDFCIDDLVKDVKAIVTYVRDRTPIEKCLFYVGHSQGGAQGLMSLSTCHKLREKVDLFVALAPGAFVNPMPSKPLRLLAYIATYYPSMLCFIFGGGSFLPFMETVRSFVPLSVMQYLAFTMFNFLFEWGDDLWDKSKKGYYFSEIPAGTSTRTIMQWMQHSITGKFQKFCHQKKNFQQYGQHSPPEYPLHQLDTPTLVIYGGKDYLLNFAELIEKLPNCILSKTISHHEHLDTLLAQDAKDHVFPEIILAFRKYSLRRQDRYNVLKSCLTEAKFSKLSCECVDVDNIPCLQCA